jgi:methionyl-tRNA formyltransferase
MRIAFLGTPEAAVPSLAALLAADGVEVAAVVTNPDRPSGRGYKLTPPPVKVLATEAGLPVWQPEKPREVLSRLQALRLDAAAVVAYGALLPEDVLAAGGRGFVNLHFSLLPAWRGAAPVQAALLAGDAETGISCFVLEKGMDTGPVLTAARTPVGAEETAGELTARLAQLGAPVLVAAVGGRGDGTLTPRPQDHARATLAPKVTPEQARLDWSRPAAELARAVRAFNPVPGAHTMLEGQRLKVHRARVTDAEAGAPGEVVRLDDDGPVVATGEGGLALTEVQPAGRPRMPGPAFVNGYHPLGRTLHDSAPAAS